MDGEVLRERQDGAAFICVPNRHPGRSGPGRCQGYHAIDDNDNTWGRAFVSPSLITEVPHCAAPCRYPSVLSHEVLEAVVDYNINLWAERWDGTEVAIEVCDPVEADCYDVLAGTAQVPVSIRTSS